MPNPGRTVRNVENITACVPGKLLGRVGRGRGSKGGIGKESSNSIVVVVELKQGLWGIRGLRIRTQLEFLKGKRTVQGVGDTSSSSSSSSSNGSSSIRSTTRRNIEGEGKSTDSS
ncbi:hypothetical protein M0802_003772 [Mischocyttarus mexicanus]|nr:hypothetical protein M0802_003772 [Mischocyttarus mexicanus]